MVGWQAPQSSETLLQSGSPTMRGAAWLSPKKQRTRLCTACTTGSASLAAPGGRRIGGLSTSPANGVESVADDASRNGSELAMGLALLRARYLDAEVRQLAVWDGGPPLGDAGTAIDIATWRRSGDRSGRA